MSLSLVVFRSQSYCSEQPKLLLRKGVWKMSNTNTCTAVLLLTWVSACSSGVDETAPEAPVESEPAASSERAGPGDEAEHIAPIAVVELSPTHRVEFLEPTAGALLVSETGSIERDPDSRVDNFDSAAALYAELSGDAFDSAVH
jgi:hypothetical protein